MMQSQIRARIEELIRQSRELEAKLARPEAVSSPQYVELSQRYAQLKEIAQDYEELQRLEREIAETEALLDGEPDGEMRALIKDELEQAYARRERLFKKLKRALLPEDPQDARNAIIEIRAGTGGEESALFAADLFRMYNKYAERKGFKIEPLEAHPTPLGGFKTVVFAVIGRGAHGLFKFESGVHRVQRVPETEASGRIHTSTATVAVLPEAEEVDVEIREEDLEIETFRASGPGGQNVQKTETAVRIRHKPTGLVVTCQEERSQYKNRERAMRLLRAKLQDLLESQVKRERAGQRRIQIGSAARSEKIRTYNFPQNRVTDHRIDLTLYRLEDVLEGDLDLLIEPLQEAYAQERLSELLRRG
jgi:peptide chain release factor 1